MGKTVSRPGFVELDGRRLYAQVRATRDILGKDWAEVWAETGVTKSSLDKLKRGRTIEATTLMRLMKWLGILHIEHFTRVGGEDANT
jgi:DNA-binding Xre family transcriptional regulator